MEPLVDAVKRELNKVFSREWLRLMSNGVVQAEDKFSGAEVFAEHGIPGMAD